MGFRINPEALQDVIRRIVQARNSAQTGDVVAGYSFDSVDGLERIANALVQKPAGPVPASPEEALDAGEFLAATIMARDEFRTDPAANQLLAVLMAASPHEDDQAWNSIGQSLSRFRSDTGQKILERMLEAKAAARNANLETQPLPSPTPRPVPRARAVSNIVERDNSPNRQFTRIIQAIDRLQAKFLQLGSSGVFNREQVFAFVSALNQAREQPANLLNLPFVLRILDGEAGKRFPLAPEAGQPQQVQRALSALDYEAERLLGKIDDSRRRQLAEPSMDLPIDDPVELEEALPAIEPYREFLLFTARLYMRRFLHRYHSIIANSALDAWISRLPGDSVADILGSMSREDKKALINLLMIAVRECTDDDLVQLGRRFYQDLDAPFGPGMKIHLPDGGVVDRESWKRNLHELRDHPDAQLNAVFPERGPYSKRWNFYLEDAPVGGTDGAPLDLPATVANLVRQHPGLRDAWLVLPVANVSAEEPLARLLEVTGREIGAEPVHDPWKGRDDARIAQEPSFGARERLADAQIRLADGMAELIADAPPGKNAVLLLALGYENDSTLRAAAARVREAGVLNVYTVHAVRTNRFASQFRTATDPLSEGVMDVNPFNDETAYALTEGRLGLFNDITIRALTWALSNLDLVREGGVSPAELRRLAADLDPENPLYEECYMEEQTLGRYLGLRTAYLSRPFDATAGFGKLNQEIAFEVIACALKENGLGDLAQAAETYLGKVIHLQDFHLRLSWLDSLAHRYPEGTPVGRLLRAAAARLMHDPSAQAGGDAATAGSVLESDTAILLDRPKTASQETPAADAWGPVKSLLSTPGAMRGKPYTLTPAQPPVTAEMVARKAEFLEQDHRRRSPVETRSTRGPEGRVSLSGARSRRGGIRGASPFHAGRPLRPR